ncbi:MAG: glycoside hydrolase family 38 C-terminal domain-containing protein [Chthoniobacteraceae bacterium]
MTVLKGERRSYLKDGMWTFLFPGTVSARTYLKQKDFAATGALVYLAEPLAAMAASYGMPYPKRYLDRGWQTLISNHTHDANGGCAPDAVCEEMASRYAKAIDIADIVTEDAMCHVAKNLSPEGQEKGAMQLIVFNSLPVERDAIARVDLEIPAGYKAKAARLEAPSDTTVERQAISSEKSSSFVDSIWEVPRIVASNRIKFYAKFNKLPGLGYRAYSIVPEPVELRSRASIAVNDTTLENEFLRATVKANGTVDLVCKKTGKTYRQLNYLTSQGECGNALKHVAPAFDRKYNSLGAQAVLSIKEKGPLVGCIEAVYGFEVPVDYGNGTGRSNELTRIPVRVEYRLKKSSQLVEVTLILDNTAKDHLLRANLPSGIQANRSVSDTHFDVVERPIAIPDSTGWVEEAFGAQPLQTFASLDDGSDCLAILPKGLFEYEVQEDDTRTLSLTLLRACRIKLAVSEEKVTELPDEGIQCLGKQTFAYSIFAGAGDWRQNALLTEAAQANEPLRLIMAGRGHGSLPREGGLFILDNTLLHVSAVKQAEDGDGLIIRLFNPATTAQPAQLAFNRCIAKAIRSRMDESPLAELQPSGDQLALSVEAKKIVTLRLHLA